MVRPIVSSGDSGAAPRGINRSNPAKSAHAAFGKELGGAQCGQPLGDRRRYEPIGAASRLSPASGFFAFLNAQRPAI